MKMSDLKRPVQENASMGAVGGGAIASTAGIMPGIRKRTPEKRKKAKRKTPETY